MPSLAFDDGGKTVQAEKDPAALYRSFVEFSLRSRWNRPTDIADAHYFAEIEIAVDAVGRISAPRWKRKTGDARWDASVLDAIAQTKTLDRPPPAGFPVRLTVRFDVVQSAECNHSMKIALRSHHTTLAELNITPLLDLVFVLLVIFIITTPQLMNNLELSLPSGTSDSPKPADWRTSRSLAGTRFNWIPVQ